MGSAKLLDHGYIEYVEHWGSDERIIEAARMSTGKGFQGWGPKHSGECNSNYMASMGDSECICEPQAGDEKLLAYLWNNKHATPFEMGGLVIEVQAPIFVFREWHRHRTQSYNEMSARYTPLPDLNYVPTLDRLKLTGSSKQAQGTEPLADDAALQRWLDWVAELQRDAQSCYETGLKLGVPKELARLPVPVARYSRMRASANLRNWLGFLTLRQAPNAQWEIRQYADALNVILVSHFPRTMELFNATH